MGNLLFATLRLGKTSVEDILKLDATASGLKNPVVPLSVTCAQVPLNYGVGRIVMIWFGSDNSNGQPTSWKQGFKAIGRVIGFTRGESFNSPSTSQIEVLYVFPEAVNRKDILRISPHAYYCCSDFPIIGLDDHSNQTIRLIEEVKGLNDVNSFFYTLNEVSPQFKESICQVIPELEKYFRYFDINQKKYYGGNSRFDFMQDNKYRPFLTAIKTKPFVLLAGISGTGKSRIVRELARACWEPGSEKYKDHEPSNYKMIQVKPNWHDSSELIGFVTRVGGEKFVVGPFLKFLVKALKNPEVPHFLCLDEMNLAPVEQYFAEYLSVIESRKVENGEVVTDPIIDFDSTDAYKSLIDQLFPTEEEERKAYLTEVGGKRLRLPKNLIVVGTVNMDETTFSFSRKVLDRAMSIEMNEVNLRSGLEERHESIGKLGMQELVGTAVEGVDVYADNKEVCDKVLTYLEAVNKQLNGTPFKVAYRTRNEFLLYVVNNLPYKKDEEGKDVAEEMIIARALDEVTSMKILSRIEGDESKIKVSFLTNLMTTIGEQLKAVSQKDYTWEEGKEDKLYSESLAKLYWMKERLSDTGFTDFWG